ncbi:MAG TPA: AraC family transcriptional regulator, partial [Gemmatimonadales bacterium]|nr:AraC family transcriptional regulator [Gemmatimonadales bacterium]
MIQTSALPDSAEPSASTFISFGRHAVLGGVDLIRARFVNHASQGHAHSDYEIGMIGMGQRLVRCRGREYHASAGSIVVFAPGEVHSGAPLDQQGSTYQSFLVSAGTLGAAPWFSEPVIQDPALAERLAAVHRELEERGWSTESEEELRSALAQLVERHGIPGDMVTVGQEPLAVREVRLHLEANYASLIRLEPLARQVGLSVFQLIRLFRAETGLPPYAYLEQIRIDRAVGMLRAGVPISEVADRTGFS